MIITLHGKHPDLGFGVGQILFDIMGQIHFISTCRQSIGGKHSSSIAPILVGILNFPPSLKSYIFFFFDELYIFFLLIPFFMFFLIEKYKYKGAAALPGWIMEFL